MGERREVEAGRFASELATALGVAPEYAVPAYDDPWKIIRDESNLPLNVDPLNEDTKSEGARKRLADRLQVSGPWRHAAFP